MKTSGFSLIIVTEAAKQPLPEWKSCQAEMVIEVHTSQSPLHLADVGNAGIAHRAVPVQTSIVRALNTALALSSGQWVVLIFPDQGIAKDVWPELALSNDTACVRLFETPFSGLPIVAVQRTAFIYGALNEAFPSSRFAIFDWISSILPAASNRVAPCEGVQTSLVDWVTAHQPPLQCSTPLSVLMSLRNLSPWVKADLLKAAISQKDNTQELQLLLDKELACANASSADPYRDSEDYDPKCFWEDNTAGYVKWEVYQPDEPEIMELTQKVAPNKVLELGCGVGRNTRYFSEAQDYVGLDISMNLLTKAKERQEENSLGILCGDATRLPFVSNHFDLIFADSTIQHIVPERIAICVEELCRVSSKHICVIEFTDEISEDGTWFEQSHMFKHDYEALFAPHASLEWKQQISFQTQPAVKNLFLFKKA